MGFVDHPRRQAPVHFGVVAVDQRLGQQRQRTDRRLQLVADVGHEVGAHRIEARPLAEIVDGGERSAVAEGHRPHQQHPHRRTEEASTAPPPARRGAPTASSRSIASLSRTSAWPVNVAAGLRARRSPARSASTMPTGTASSAARRRSRVGGGARGGRRGRSSSSCRRRRSSLRLNRFTSPQVLQAPGRRP